MSTVTLSNVRRSYGRTLILDDVSLTAPEGEVLALLGPSGSGKSTILRLIAGLEPVDAGAITIGGEIVSQPRATLRPEDRRIGFVFQDYALFPHLSAGANVCFGLDHLPRADREAKARHWLERVGLGSRIEAMPHELSGGEQQRVALARALAPGPRAVLMDEPFSGLDAALRNALRDTMLTTLREARTTTLFVTHDAEDALQVADRLAILKAGRVLQEAPPRQAYDQPASLDAAVALGIVNSLASRVTQGQCETPFGPVRAPHLADGAEVIIAVRAEALRLKPGAQARVIDLRPHGPHDLAQLENKGVVWRALIPARQGLGERVDVEIDAHGAFVFAR